ATSGTNFLFFFLHSVGKLLFYGRLLSLLSRRSRTMSSPIFPTLWGRKSRTRLSRRPTRTRLFLEQLEDPSLLSGTAAITPSPGPSATSAPVPPATEGLLASPPLIATFTDTNSVSAADLTAQIDYGDGTSISTATITQIGTSDQYTVTDPHLFPEESGSTVP